MEIGRLHRLGNEVVVTHGNGPQVGELLIEEQKNLAVLTAQTEAETGLQVQESLERHGRIRRAAVVLTRVEVDPHDVEFRKPTKPIGKFYKSADAASAVGKGRTVRKLIGGYRIVVPSPMPSGIMELGQISDLLDDGYVVIAGGGGGAAVSSTGRQTKYMDAVIDKDYTSSLLASMLRADILVILTGVDAAYAHFGKRSQSRISNVTVSEMEKHVKNGEFEEGSMLPKVRACCSFINASGKQAVIGSLKDARNVLKGRSGSVIVGK